jgi:uncharacterized repeat protein (TIGR03806 family)
VIWLLLACGGADPADTDGDTDAADTDAPVVACEEPPCELLSEYGFWEGDLADLEPRDGVLLFEPNAVLWSDNAQKQRLIVLPEGASVSFDPMEAWTWPEGAMLVKSFFFPADLREPDGPRRIVETRILLREGDGWTGHVYLWNAQQTDAERFVAGTITDVTYTDRDGVAREERYVVPNTNQCASCHTIDDVMRPLGPVTPQLNRDVQRDGQTVNQLEWLADNGIFAADLPDVSGLHAFEPPDGDGPLDLRARAWLHANCAHCHREGGGAGNSGLWLTEWTAVPSTYGVCKTPAAAGAGTGGFTYDIVPGVPEESILIYRLSSTEPDEKMPEIPNLLPDPDGVALVAAWIDAMTPEGCD